jgi:hypothetical protein
MQRAVVGSLRPMGRTEPGISRYTTSSDLHAEY